MSKEIQHTESESKQTTKRMDIMEELQELRSHIEHGKYHEAMILIGEMEEMSRDDKIYKIRSFAKILLLHIIKQEAEKRTTRSWEISVRNSAREISYINKRRKSGGLYVTDSELKEILSDAYPSALEYASMEAFEGACDEKELGKMVSPEEIKNKAFDLIKEYQSNQDRFFH